MAGHCPEKDRTVKKKQEQKQKPKDTKTPARATTGTSKPSRDWQPLFGRLREALDWALDIAAQLAQQIDEDVEAVERTRTYVHAWIDGRPIEVDMYDVYTTLAVLFAAIEIDLGIDSSPILASLLVANRMLHLPGAVRDDEPTIVIRTPVQRRRNSSCGVFTQLAA